MGTFIWGGKKAANSEISRMMSSRWSPSVPRQRLTNFLGLAFFKKESEKSHELHIIIWR
jgi:hypothetical protein